MNQWAAILALTLMWPLSTAAGHLMDYQAIFTHPPRHVPTRGMPDGPLLGNGDVGIVLAGPPARQTFYIGKNDFWTRTPDAAKIITVGRVKLNMPALEGATYLQKQELASAQVCGAFTKGHLTVHTRSWVAADENLLVTQITCAGGRLKIAVRPAGGSAGPRQVQADTLPGRACKVAVVTRILGRHGMQMTLKPGETATLATAILSNFNVKKPLRAAQELVARLTPQKVAALAARHRAWWDDFWARSFIDIPDKLIEAHWYAALYVMGSCSRAGDTAPGLWGNWVTTDQPHWQGDFHLNYNFEAPYYIVYSSNHCNLSLPFYQAIKDWMPLGRATAKKRGWKGVTYPSGIGPRGLTSYSPYLDWGQRSDAAFAGLNFIWYWQYTQDKKWLQTTGYPYLRQVVKFWDHYLKFEQGRYVDVDDAIQEGHWPTDVNPILTLGLLRTLYTNIIPMSETLGVDAAKRARWRHILARLSPFPTWKRRGHTVFRYTQKGTAWWPDNTLGIQAIFPAGAIGLDSNPKLLHIARNTINAMHRWADYNGFSSWYTACARVGYNPRTILKNLHTQCVEHSLPNLLLSYGGGGIESCGGFLAINEMLLQSYDGVIRLFPDWPRNLNARFGTLRAVGAFLVSAQLKDGIVRGVKIISEKGRDCTIVNPWPGQRVRVIRNGKPAEWATGERFTLKTTPHEILELAPSANRSACERGGPAR